VEHAPPRPVGRPVAGALWGLLALGGGAAVAGLLTEPARAWQIYLVNFLFWSGLAQGGVVFAAIYHVVGGRWSPAIRRLGEGMAAFLPVSLVLFLPLYFGLEAFFGPVRAINPLRGGWFDHRFIFVRGFLGLGSMTVLSLLFVYYSLRPEVGPALERGLGRPLWLYRWMAQEWHGPEVERERGKRGMDVLAAGVLLAYPITYTFMAFDLVMALDPFWYSSLFGGYFFISTFYLGLAGTVVVAVLARRFLGLSAITPDQLADLGKLLFGFTLTYGAMLWSQYIVIWYGNLPEETHFVVLRLWERPWAVLSWAVLVATLAIPFLVFLGRQAKRVPGLMLAVATLIALGLWLERFVLVVPSLWHHGTVPFGWLEAGVTAGFLGAAGLSYVFFLRHFPLVPTPGPEPRHP
jgi:Ni/Fe-hydrogenase subunit HybB-like protein